MFYKSLMFGILSAIFTTTHATQFNCCDNGFDGYIDFSAGYRNDHYSVKAESSGTPGSIILFAADDVKFKNMSIWEIGGKGRLSYCNVYLRGHIFGGWNTHGNLDEVGVLDGVSSDITASVHSGNTLDGLIGVGYLFTFNDCYCNKWGIGPVGGWAYDRQTIKLKEVEVDGVEDATLVDQSFRQTWQGPWAGVDLLFEKCHFLVHAGYEYHWSNWRIARKFPGQPLGVSAAHLKSDNAHCNVGYIDTRYLFCNCFSLGLGFKYQYWHANGGHQTDAPTGVTTKVNHANWKSYEVTLDLGYVF